MANTLTVQTGGQTVTVSIIADTGLATTLATVGGSPVTFPNTITTDTVYTLRHGTYTVSALVDGLECYGRILAFYNGESVTIAPSPTAQQLAQYDQSSSGSYVSQGTQTISVKDVAYGAKGDGTTDDTVAIQAAITAANGAQVLIPAGSYKITASVTLPAGTRLIGLGYASQLTPTGSGTLTVTGSNVRITDLRSTGVVNTTIGVQIDNTTARTDVTIRGCVFENHTQGIYINRCQDATISERWLISQNKFVNVGVGLFAVAANRVTFSDNVSTSTNNATQHVVFYAGQENKIIGNQFTYGKTGVLFLCRSDIGTAAAPFLKNVISNNVVREMSEEGISFDVNASTAATTGAMELDTVATKPGSSVITLTAAGWSSAASQYVGYYVAFLSGALQGSVAKITAQTAGSLTLSISATQYSSLTAGDTVAIVLPFLHNTISGNVVDASSRGTTTAITLYGACYFNTVTGNTCIGKNLSLRSLTGLVKPTTSYTNANPIATVESNAVTGNAVFGANVSLTWVDFGSVTTNVTKGNAVSGNVARDGKVELIRQSLTAVSNWSEVAPDHTGSDGVTYVDTSQLKFRGAAGAITTLAPAAGGAGTLAQLYGINGTTGCLAATYDRVTSQASQAAGAATSGTLRMYLIALPAGTVCTSLTVWAGTTAGASLTHSWAALFDASRNQVALSADNTGATWTAGTSRTFTFTSPYTVGTTGAFYVGLTIAGTTIPTIEATTGAGAMLTVGSRNVAPIAGGNADAGLGAPATCPATAGAISVLAQLAYCEIH